jgi:hypothetical protein
MRSSLLLLALAGGLASACAGGGGDTNEVDVVVQSDLGNSAMLSGLIVRWASGTVPVPDGAGFSNPHPVFPMTLAFRAPHPPFSLNLGFQLQAEETAPRDTLTIFRSLSDVEIVAGQRLMVPFPLFAKCACVGTACAQPLGDPDCDDVITPVLEPFDPAVASASPDQTFDVD